MNQKAKVGKTEVPVRCSYSVIEAIENLKPNPENPNEHPNVQIELLGKIIQFQGWRNPIVVSKLSGLITKGHARLDAAKKMGYKFVPVDMQDYDDPAQEYADMVADNQIAELSRANLVMIRAKAIEIGDGLLDIDYLGIPDFELEVEDLSDEIDIDSEKPFDGVMRNIVLIFDQQKYVEIVEQATRVMEKCGCDNFSSLFEFLLGDADESKDNLR